MHGADFDSHLEASHREWELALYLKLYRRVKFRISASVAPWGARQVARERDGDLGRGGACTRCGAGCRPGTWQAVLTGWRFQTAPPTEAAYSAFEYAGIR